MFIPPIVLHITAELATECSRALQDYKGHGIQTITQQPGMTTDGSSDFNRTCDTAAIGLHDICLLLNHGNSRTTKLVNAIIVHAHIRMYVCMYTYIHVSCTYIYTCIHTYIHAYIHTYIHTYIHAYMHTYIHTYIHVHTYIHAYIHTSYCTCTYIHTCFATPLHVICITQLRCRCDPHHK